MGGMEREGLPYRQPTNRPFSHTYSISIILCSLKKLHKVQLLVDACNVFYQPNLERQLAAQDNVIGTRTFAANQYDLNFSWAQMEEQAGGGVAMGVGVGYQEEESQPTRRTLSSPAMRMCPTWQCATIAILRSCRELTFAAARSWSLTYCSR